VYGEEKKTSLQQPGSLFAKKLLEDLSGVKGFIFLLKIWYAFPVPSRAVLEHVVTVANSPSYAQSRLDRKVGWGI
jgi:hypothetical protein